MRLTETELNNVEISAYRGFEVQQIAHLLGRPVQEFKLAFNQENSPIAMRFYKGVYQAQSDLRASIIESALSGSSPAQAEVKKFLDSAINSAKLISGHE